MDFDGIAHEWAGANSLSAPTILSTLLAFDAQQVQSLRVSVARHPQLAHAIEVIDGFTAFQEAKRRLEEAKLASADMARHAKALVGKNELSSALAQANVERASDAQEAASEAFKKATSPREKIDAAVVLELADNAARQAREAADAADKLTTALANLVRATKPPVPDGFGGK